MPVYEYQCESCEHRYSALVSIKDSEDLPQCPRCGIDSEDLPQCPRCGNEQVRKVPSSVAVVRSAGQKDEDRSNALSQVDPSKPQDVAKHFRDHGSQFGEDDFRGTKEWHDAVDRVAEGGPTLDE